MTGYSPPPLSGNTARPLRADDPVQLGAYRVIGRLGQGGMGAVFLGQAPDGTAVAIKVIRPELASRPEFRARFAREAESARRVRRFTTAAVLDADPTGPQPYLVTEFVEGPTLSRHVSARGPMRPADLEQLAVSVATALSAIHAAGIVHRDLTPANVLLSPVGPKVIDFGLAREYDTVSDLSRNVKQAIGTPGYMSPEQILDQPITAAVDVFAWGSIMIFAATGQSPFGQGRVEAVLYRIVNEQPRLDGVTGELRDLVELAMRKDPATRPTAEELRAALMGGTAIPDRTAQGPAADPAAGDGAAAGRARRWSRAGRRGGSQSTAENKAGDGSAGGTAAGGGTAAAARGADATEIGVRPSPTPPPAPTSSPGAVPRSPAPLPHSPAPHSPAPRSPAPHSQAPHSQAPRSPAPHSQAPGSGSVAPYPSTPYRPASGPPVSGQQSPPPYSPAPQYSPAPHHSGPPRHSAPPQHSPPPRHSSAPLARSGPGAAPTPPNAGAPAPSSAGQPAPAPAEATTGRRRLDRKVLIVACAALVAAAIAVPVVILGGGGDDSSSTAGREAVATRVAANAAAARATDPELAARLSLAAYRIAPVPAAQEAMIASFGAGTAVQVPATGSLGRDVAFSPSGSVLAEAAADGTLRLYRLIDGGEPTVLSERRTGDPADPTGDPADLVVFDQDGDQLALSGTQVSARLWDVTDPANPKERPEATGLTGSDQVELSADGSLLAAASTQTFALWRLAGQSAPEPPRLQRTASLITDLALSPAGGLLAAATIGGEVQLWDISDPTMPKQVSMARGAVGAVNALAFSSDGKRLVVGGDDRTVRIWEVADPKQARLAAAMAGHTAPVTAVAFGPAGQVVSGDQAGNVRFWGGSQPPATVPVGTLEGAVLAVAVNQAGDRIALTTENGPTTVWSIAPDHLLAVACANSAARISQDEWNARIKDVPYTDPCGV